MRTDLVDLLKKHNLTFHWDPSWPAWYLNKLGDLDDVGDDLYWAFAKDLATAESAAIDFLATYNAED